MVFTRIRCKKKTTERSLDTLTKQKPFALDIFANIIVGPLLCYPLFEVSVLSLTLCALLQQSMLDVHSCTL